MIFLFFRVRFVSFPFPSTFLSPSFVFVSLPVFFSCLRFSFWFFLVFCSVLFSFLVFWFSVYIVVVSVPFLFFVRFSVCDFFCFLVLFFIVFCFVFPSFFLFCFRPWFFGFLFFSLSFFSLFLFFVHFSVCDFLIFRRSLFCFFLVFWFYFCVRSWFFEFSPFIVVVVSVPFLIFSFVFRFLTSWFLPRFFVLFPGFLFFRVFFCFRSWYFWISLCIVVVSVPFLISSFVFRFAIFPVIFSSIFFVFS